MLLKIYETYEHFVGQAEEFKDRSERMHIIDDAEDVVVHQGNYCLPTPKPNSPVIDFSGWGPAPQWFSDDYIKLYGHPELTNGATVRVIDYTKNNQRFRALISSLCYVCNNQGKTIERIELYSVAKLSVA